MPAISKTHNSTPKSDWAWSLDVLLLLVLVPAHVSAAREFLLVVALLVYVWLAILSPLHRYSELPRTVGRVRLLFLSRLLLIFVMITTAVIVPTLENIFFRIANPADTSGYTEAYAQMHDGAVQMEAALNHLQQGINPYDVDYSDTPLRFYSTSGLEVSTNPAYSYFVYLPGYLLLSFPTFVLFDQLQFFYDQRLIYLTFYILLVLLLPILVEKPVLKLSLLTAVGLNPLVTGPVKLGMNDVAVLTVLSLVALTLLRRRLLLSAILFALACTLKQSAWLVSPFFLLLVHNLVPSDGRHRKLALFLGAMAFIFLAAVLPFILWNPAAFITDVISYPAGTAPVTYPIRGSTIGELLVGSGLIESRLSPFPFGVLQLLFGLPALLLLLRYQWRRNHVAGMLTVSGLFVFTLGFFSRFFQSNYVGFVLGLMTMGVVLHMESTLETKEMD